MSRHRKAIAAGVGVALIALAEYAVTTPDVERALESVVPSPWSQLVPILFGGAATVAAVWRASNTPQSAAGDTVPAEPAAEVPADPAPLPVPVAASPPDDQPSTTGAGADSVPPIAEPEQRHADDWANDWDAYLAQRDDAQPRQLPEPAPATSIVQLRPVPVPDFR